MSSRTLLILLGLGFAFFNSEEIEHYVSEKTEFGAALSPELPPLPSLPTNLLAKSNALAEASTTEDNFAIESEADQVLDFDERNPFGSF